MIIPVNPYTAGDPVGKSESFVGRADVLRNVLQTLRNPNQNAITLYGQRRIGKTSVLQYLELHLPEEGPYRPVYFDLMNETGLPLEKILQHLARTIALRLGLPDPDLGRSPERAFRETFLPQALKTLPQASSLVLLLDEFDVLADPKAEKAAKQRFFGYLRELRRRDPRRLQFVFVLGRNVADLDIVALRLFKDLPAARVSLLSRADAEAVVRLSERNDTLRWEEAAVARVWELAAGHPYLTQALCSQVWEAAYEAQEEDEPPHVGPEAVEAAVPSTLEASRNMFEWLWGGLDPAERVAAAALAEAGPVVLDEDRLATILAESGIRIMIRELQDAPRILEKWDILERVNGGYRFRVELIRRWVAANRPPSRVQDELDRLNPVADNLFNAAQGLYRDDNLKQAEDLLRQALGLNPSHIRAHELLSRILLSQGNPDEAGKWLEKLQDLAPGRARPYLKQLYLRRAEAAESDEKALSWYEKVLSLYPGDRQAEEGRRRIYRQQGERALQAGKYEAAREAFRRAGDEEGCLRAGLAEIEHLEGEKAYAEALERCREMAETYPRARDWQPDLERLEKKARLAVIYRQGIAALRQGDRDEAKERFAEAIALEPDYEEAARYLYLAVTGQDPVELSRALEETQKSLEQTQQVLTSPEPEARPRPLSIWNPPDYWRLLWWVLVRPERLKAYRKAHGRAAERPVSNRLALALSFWPLLMSSLGLGLMPYGGQAWATAMDALGFGITPGPISPWLWAALAIGIVWALLWSFGDLLDDAEGWTGVVAGGVAGGVALGVAGGVAGGVALGVALGVAGGVALGVAGDVAFVVASVVAFGVAFSVAFGVTFGVTSVVAGSVGFAINEGKPALWAPALLTLSWLTLAFLSFGGPTWLQSGTWPHPIWPF